MRVSDLLAVVAALVVNCDTAQDAEDGLPMTGAPGCSSGFVGGPFRCAGGPLP